ncbi:hypothetical protein BGZ65_000445 [Modicella reniformis]|uniref:Uncharacterized protein n=1 Tax=Modicella reniformis TaxID=1440133 RepID=A0A9P6MA97_9FUNG|nr:hypothetical protein BGZ65_000445 [Modicella reniformis]
MTSRRSSARKPTSANSKRPQKPTSAIDMQVKTSGIQDALQAAADTTANSLYNNKTRTSYHYYVKRGKEFLASLEDAELSSAFDVLGKSTPTALIAFVAHKCDLVDTSYKTAEAIHSSFKQHFRDHLKCQGDFWRQDVNGQWIGNPVHDQQFDNYMTSLKKQCGRSNIARHRLSMSYTDLSVIMEYLQRPEVASQGESICLFFQEFAATAFTTTGTRSYYAFKGGI